MKFASIEDVHANRAKSDRPIRDARRAEIDRALPDAARRIRHAHPVCFLGGNPSVGHSRLKHCVWFFFWSGRSFDAPGLELDGKVKAEVQHVHDVLEIDAAALAVWLKDSTRIKRDDKTIVKKNGPLDRLK